MMGENPDLLKHAFRDYKESLKVGHLFKHTATPFVNMKMREFWNAKTRLPYKWGNPQKDVFPWITFAGYDINWEGDTRIRKSTIKKEIKKQYEKYIEILHLFSYGTKSPQWSRHYIYRSVLKRMVGMSVGRAHIWDYRTFDNDYSWAGSFTELTDNKWSRRQLRLLDNHRIHMMHLLDKFLAELDYKHIKPAEELSKEKNIYYGKPFSYYGQVLKKW